MTPLDGECWQFYRCYRCGELLNDLQVKAGLAVGKICSCGCDKITPTEVKPQEYYKKNVLEMAIHLGFNEQQIIEDFCAETPTMIAVDKQGFIEQIRKNYAEVLACA